MRYFAFSWAAWRAIISLASVVTLPGQCQQSNQTTFHRQDTCLNSAEGPSNIATSYSAIGTIEDFGTHRHWILLRNLSHPASPAMLVQKAPALSCERPSAEGSRLRSAPDARRSSFPVIRAGDHLIVSEHTRIVDADMEATALKPAAIGESLTVRLKFGSRTLSVIATAPGRASLSEEGSGARQ
jgi:hypothetical protein